MTRSPGAASPPRGIGARRDHREVFDVVGLLDAIRRNLPMLGLWIAVCWVGAGIVLLRAPVQYTASTQVALESIPKLRGADARDTVFNALDAAQAETRAAAVKGERLLRFVYDSLHVKERPEFRPRPPSFFARLLHPFRSDAESTGAAETAAFLAFMDKVGARRIGLSYVMEISFVAPTAQGAAQMANAITAAYIRDRVLASVKEEEILERRIADIRRQADVLTTGMMKGVIPDGEFPDADARVISAAITPLTKSSPKTTLTFALATVLAIVTGLGATMLMHQSDARLHRPRQFELATGLACVAAVPHALAPRAPGADDVDSREPPDTRDVGRHLLARLRNASPGERAFGFMACQKGSGTSSICIEIARALVDEGREVIVVDANLRRPTTLHLVAQGRHTLGDLITHVNLQGFASALPRVSGIRIVGSCRREHRAEAVATSARLPDVLRALSAHAVVLVDLPALDSPDSMAQVARALTGLFVVAESGRIAREDLADALVWFRQHDVSLQGLIVTKLPVIAWRDTSRALILRAANLRRGSRPIVERGQVVAAE